MTSPGEPSQRHSRPTASHTYRSLDGLRGIFALVIALFHLNIEGHFYDFPLVRNSYLSVDFFFVLSGFIITDAYAGRLLRSGGFAQVTIRRIARLWPLHVVMLALFMTEELVRAGLVLAGHHLADPLFQAPAHGLRQAALNLFLLHSMGLYGIGSWNLPSWSISVEFWAGLLFSAITVLCRGKTMVIALMLVLAAMALGALVAFRVPADNLLNVGLLRCIAGFFAGHLVHRLMGTIRRRRLGLAPLPGTLCEAAVLLMALAFAGEQSWRQYDFLAPLPAALLVAIFSIEAGLFARLLKTTALQRLGRWSYSIYMTHYLLTYLLWRAVPLLERHGLIRSSARIFGGLSRPTLIIGTPWTMDAIAMLYLALVIVIGRLAYRWIEMPGQTLMLRLLSPTRATAAIEVV